MKKLTVARLRTRRLGLPRVLIVGCGDVGMRAVPLLQGRYRIFAVTSDPQRVASLREAGVVPLVANLDQPASLRRLASLAPRVLHLAPPQNTGSRDRRTRGLLHVLSRATPARHAHAVGLGHPRQAYIDSILPDRDVRARRVLIYASTSGVYGDQRGALVYEHTMPRPTTDRAVRRVDAETAIRRFGNCMRWRTTILRIPGIYADNRLPLERLARGTPALQPADDVYTNHIHADDLARIVVTAMTRGRPQRIVHASDDSRLLMGEYLDLVAERTGLPKPPRLSRDAVRSGVSPVQFSFMSESRQLDNRRLRNELRIRLRYPSVQRYFDSRPQLRAHALMTDSR
jgi:nucleoside-diphosphate-sugar epimerase